MPSGINISIGMRGVIIACRFIYHHTFNEIEAITGVLSNTAKKMYKDVVNRCGVPNPTLEQLLENIEPAKRGGNEPFYQPGSQEVMDLKLTLIANKRAPWDEAALEAGWVGPTGKPLSHATIHQYAKQAPDPLSRVILQYEPEIDTNSRLSTATFILEKLNENAIFIMYDETTMNPWCTASSRACYYMDWSVNNARVGKEASCQDILYARRRNV